MLMLIVLRKNISQRVDEFVKADLCAGHVISRRRGERLRKNSSQVRRRTAEHSRAIRGFGIACAPELGGGDFVKCGRRMLKSKGYRKGRRTEGTDVTGIG